MNAIRGTFRPGVLLVLIGWMILVGIPVIFRGGSVRTILSAVGGAVSDPSQKDIPWETIWLVGILVILAIGFLTRKRA